MIVGVLGLGYVGLPLCREFVQGGVEVIGFDVDEDKIQQLNNNKSYIKHISDEIISDMTSMNQFYVTTDMNKLGEPDAILITVPTPLNKTREPDLSYVEKSAQEIAVHLRRGQLVVLESTTYPGTTREIILPLLEEGSGLKCGEDFFLAYSPEREDPGRKNFTTKTIPKVIGGIDDKSLNIAVDVYKKAIDQVVPVRSCEIAEASKILENTYRCVNIALVNELKTLFDRMDIDIWEVIHAAKTKPFGFTPFYPGPGLGGHCIPIDPFYLSWRARKFDQATRFIELAGEINCAMPLWVVNKTAEALNKDKKSVNGSKILLLGLAYKPNIDDDRESPSFKLMSLLDERGADIDFYDPYIPIIGNKREYAQYSGKTSVELTANCIQEYDCVLIATDHVGVDYDLVLKNAKLIVDTRHTVSDAENVVRA